MGSGEIPEEFSMSAVDMSMIDHIPDMIENGVDSLKIEGRMKSIHYVSTVTNCYTAAVDAYLETVYTIFNHIWNMVNHGHVNG